MLYTNCDGYKSSSETLRSLACTNSASHSLKLLLFDAESDCHNHELIQCDQRIFSPEVDTGTMESQSCIQHSELGEVCLNLTERSFNTAGASDDDSEYLAGGPYNYQEFNCYYKKFSHNQSPIFSSSEDSLEKSIDKLYTNCKAGGNL